MSDMDQRHNEILDLLYENRSMAVTEIAKHMGVSLVTVRKDLTFLEEKGLIRRSQGYAMVITDSSMNLRMVKNYPAKRKIAALAATLVHDGDTILIESGSCCMILAEELSHCKKDLTIVTNSVFMASYIGNSPNIHLVLLGGEYQADSLAVVGSLAKASLASFRIKYFFSGTDGYWKGRGFSSTNLARTELLQEMASRAEHTVILAESKKFHNEGNLFLFPLSAVDALVSEEQPPEEIREEILAGGIKILVP